MKVVIIGAGVAGLSIGWRLAEALSGKAGEVMVLERAQPGMGATRAAAGMIAVTAELLDSQPAEIEFAQYSNALWPDFAAQIEAAGGRKIGFARPGALILAEDEAALARLARQAGKGTEILTAEAARAHAPLVTGPLAGALWSPREALVDNRALGAALATAFQRAGGKLKTNEAVVRIEKRDGAAAVAHTPFGLYHADAFVLAAGGWSAQLEPELAPIAPVKGEMIALKPPRGVAVAGPVIWGNGIYAVPREGQLLIGATMEEAGFDTGITEAARDFLWGRARAIMPGLAGWVLAEQWAGLRPRSPDSLPLLGPTTTPGLWLAGGQFRNGILFAPAVAETMTAQILGKAAPIAAFDPRRLGTRP